MLEPEALEPNNLSSQQAGGQQAGSRQAAGRQQEGRRQPTCKYMRYLRVLQFPKKNQSFFAKNGLIFKAISKGISMGSFFLFFHGLTSSELGCSWVSRPSLSFFLFVMCEATCSVKNGIALSSMAGAEAMLGHLLGSGHGDKT